MAILNNNPLIGSGGNQGYSINNSLRFRSSASAYLSKTFSSSGTIDTWSFWVKRGTLGTAQNIFGTSNGTNQSYGIEFTSSNTLQVFDYLNSYRLQLDTTQVFRDPSAWYHIVVGLDTTQATSSNRCKVYVNGTQVTAFGTATYPTQNTSLNIGSSASVAIGLVGNVGGQAFDGYLAEVNFIDGQAKIASDFGETDTTTGVWKPKAYSGTYGTNGFYLKFSDIATTSGSNAGLGKDFSGNSNYWTTNNISVTAGTTYDAMTDSPTNTSATVANYATLNPNLRQTGTGQAPTSANLKLTANTTGYSQVCCATIASPSGKFYWEVTVNGGVGTIGIADSNNSAFTSVVCSTSATTSDPNEYTWGWSVNLGSGNKKNNNVSTSYGSAASSGDVYMCAVDIDNSKVWWGKNGTWFASGSPTAGTNAAYTNVSGNIIPYLSPTDGSGYTNDINFGQRPFAYTPPTGFVALNTYNLPTPTILQGNKYMDALAYAGDGTSPRNITGLNFQPDLVWEKNRSTAASHNLYDVIRGTGNSAELQSNSTGAEGSSNNETWGYLSSFLSNGFQATAGTSGYIYFNSSSYSYVGWCWKANGAGSSNTSGSITSTVSVNTTAGFSIVTYTGNGTNGATVGHGLGVAPKMIILKSRSDGTYNWRVYHSNLTSGYSIAINSTAAETQFATNAGYISAVSSTTFTLTQSGANTLEAVNKNGDNYVAYCWAEIAGFSRFGSYTGNGSTDGPFVFCNFSPKFVMIKRTDATDDWVIMDSTRNPYNVIGNELYADLSGAEGTGYQSVDYISNGFKLRSTGARFNASGGTYIFMAFSSNPFKNSLAR